MQYVSLSAFQSPPTYPSLVHRWLHDIPRILHRDLSLNNIMCRFKMEENAKGNRWKTLWGANDYDLSSWTKDLKGDYTRTSQQRTGTPPYMAHELLTGTSTTHLYRHDVESLFYIMLLVCARYTIADAGDGTTRVVRREMKRLPYEEWFNQPNYAHSDEQEGVLFLSKTETIDISPVFEGFRPWLIIGFRGMRELLPDSAGAVVS
jgi:hypothetical protein